MGPCWVIDKVNCNSEAAKMPEAVLVARRASQAAEQVAEFEAQSSCFEPASSSSSRNWAAQVESSSSAIWLPDALRGTKSSRAGGAGQSRLRGGQFGSAAGLYSKAIMQTPVVEAVVPWLSRSRRYDFANLRCGGGGGGCGAGATSVDDARIWWDRLAMPPKATNCLGKIAWGRFFFGMCGSGIVKGTASPGAFGLFADGSGFFGRAVKSTWSVP